MRKGYSGKIITKFRVLREQYEYLHNLCDGLNDSTYLFFAHIAASTISKLKKRNSPDELFAPIYSRLIRDQIGRQYSWRKLWDRGLIEIKPYSKASGLSRRYKLADRVIDEFLEIASKRSFEEHRRAKLVNLMTGQPTTFKLASVLSDDNGNQEPKIYVDAMKTIKKNGSYFNYPAVASVVNKRREEAERRWVELQTLEQRGASKDSKQYEDADKKYKEAKGRWQNDYYCFLSVLYQHPTPVTETIWRYDAAYCPASSGRSQQIGGGFQSASAEMKAASVEGLEDVYNYDLEASQPNILRLQFEIAGIDKSWLDEYLSTPFYKSVYAAKAGVSVKTWKTISIALMMGAVYPDKVRRPRKKKEKAIIEALWEESGQDLKRMKEIYETLTPIIQPLVEALGEWHDWLIVRYIPSVTEYNRNRRAYVRNDVGKILYLDALPQGEVSLRKKKSKVAAFVLQGTEASYIHRLTTLGPKYGFRVIANEHDGVLSLGKISTAAMREASEKSGFRKYANLVIKDLGKAAA